MSNPLGLTEDDFIHLCTNSAQWADEAGWEPQIRSGRFEAGGNGQQDVSRHWKMAYWVGTEYTAVPLARAFLASQGSECQAVVDLGGSPAGEWVILTDYDHWADRR